MGALNSDIIGLLIGTVITLMIFGYLLGDTKLFGWAFRWALAILVGAGVGYALGVALRFILWDWILSMLRADSVGEKVFYVVPLLLGCLLLLKWFASSKLKLFAGLASLGNISIAYLVGVGTAIALSGVLLGTLIPQTIATGTALSSRSGMGLIPGLILVVGTVTSLWTFSSRRRTSKDGQMPLLAQWIQRLGHFFIVLALAVAFSGALTSALTSLVVRIWQILELGLSFLGG